MRLRFLASALLIFPFATHASMIHADRILTRDGRHIEGILVAHPNPNKTTDSIIH